MKTKIKVGESKISFGVAGVYFIDADAWDTWGGRAVSVVGSVVRRNFWQDRSAVGKKCYKACLPWDG